VLSGESMRSVNIKDCRVSGTYRAEWEEYSSTETSRNPEEQRLNAFGSAKSCDGRFEIAVTCSVSKFRGSS